MAENEDSDINAEFTVDALDKQLTELNSELLIFECSILPDVQEQNMLKQQAIDLKREYEEKITKINSAAHSIETKIWDTRKSIRETKLKVESAQRQIEQAKRLEIQSQQFEMLEARWKKMIMGAPWREWAKDHQLSGARKIAERRRLILADTMGLGKTLTSLIALDFIQTATAEATPENPVEYESW